MMRREWRAVEEEKERGSRRRRSAREFSLPRESSRTERERKAKVDKAWAYSFIFWGNEGHTLGRNFYYYLGQHCRPCLCFTGRHSVTRMQNEPLHSIEVLHEIVSFQNVSLLLQREYIHNDP